MVFHLGDDSVESIQRAGSLASQAGRVLGCRGTSVSEEPICRTAIVLLSVPCSSFRLMRNDSDPLCPHCFRLKLLRLQRNNSLLLSSCYQLIVLVLKQCGLTAWPLTYLCCRISFLPDLSYSVMCFTHPISLRRRSHL